MNVYLIRHGKTEANERHLYCGRTDLPLSPAGRAEVERLRYDIPAGVRFFTSGLRRTDETLEALFGRTAYEAVPALREMDFGKFEMRSYGELKDDPEYQAWIRGDNAANVTPGGESGSQMRARALAAFAAIQAAGEDAVIVTHGGVIAAIMEALFPNENRNRYEWQPAPGGGYALRLAGPERGYTALQARSVCQKSIF